METKCYDRIQSVLLKYPALRAKNRELGKYVQRELSQALRTRTTMVIRSLRLKGENPNFHSKFAVDQLGCSLSFLKKHIEDQFVEGMSWENHGKWHLDHKRPIASFLSQGTSDELKECFHYTNLQPLWASDNISKGKYWDGVWTKPDGTVQMVLPEENIVVKEEVPDEPIFVKNRQNLKRSKTLSRRLKRDLEQYQEDQRVIKQFYESQQQNSLCSNSL